jgi:aspartyl-tRNA(Asn)/glutamyl-tRNA(Gln) amidotransferase subunit C
MAEEFSKIVDYMAILDEADTEGVEPLYSPMLDPQPPREDVPRSEEGRSDAILREAPELVGRYFSVPRCFLPPPGGRGPRAGVRSGVFVRGISRRFL